MAHNKKLSSKDSIRRENLDASENEISPERPWKILNCYRCECEGHCAVDCMSKIPDERRRSGYEELHATDVVDLDTQETSGSDYAVNLPCDLGPVEPSLQYKFIK